MTASPLRLSGYVDLPAHVGKGGFDHAAVHAASGHVYVAHTANDAIDVFDPAARRHLFSVPGLPAVAGALVSDEASSSSRPTAARTRSASSRPGPNPESAQDRRSACGPTAWPTTHRRRLVLAANVGDPAVPHSYTLSMVDLDGQCDAGVDRRAAAARAGLSSIPRPTLFFVNIMQPSQIVVVDARQARRDRPHDRRARRRRARPRLRSRDRAGCSAPATAGVLVTLDAASGKVLNQGKPERRAGRRLVQSPSASTSMSRSAIPA